MYVCSYNRFVPDYKDQMKEATLFFRSTNSKQNGLRPTESQPVWQGYCSRGGVYNLLLECARRHIRGVGLVYVHARCKNPAILLVD